MSDFPQWVTPDPSWIRYAARVPNGDISWRWYVLVYAPFDDQRTAYTDEKQSNAVYQDAPPWQYTNPEPGYVVQVLCYNQADMDLATAPYTGPVVPCVPGGASSLSGPGTSRPFG